MLLCQGLPTAGAAAGGHLQATQPLLPPGRQQHFLSHFGHKYFKLIFQILVRSVVQLWKNIKLKLNQQQVFNSSLFSEDKKCLFFRFGKLIFPPDFYK